MTPLFNLLRDSLLAQVADPDVAVLLSGGVDSTSVAASSVAAGLRVCAYTFSLAGYRSEDVDGAKAIARAIGIPLRHIEIPTNHAAEAFVRLAYVYKCRRKTQFECSFPLEYVLPMIDERVVLTGFNADDHYGNTKKVILKYAALAKAGVSADARKAIFDADRRALFDELIDDPNSADTWAFAKRIAAGAGKFLVDPYLDEAVRAYFLRFSHDELCSPLKPLVRAELERLLGATAPSFNAGVRYQKGASVHVLFERLLDDRSVNRFDRIYRSVSPLCQRWGREVAAGYGP